jgi:hypothetical protein
VNPTPVAEGIGRDQVAGNERSISTRNNANGGCERLCERPIVSAFEAFARAAAMTD